jgi:hypothetical protein
MADGDKDINKDAEHKAEENSNKAARPGNSSESGELMLSAQLAQSMESSLGLGLYDDSAHSRFFARLLEIIKKLEYEKSDLEQRLDKVIKPFTDPANDEWLKGGTGHENTDSMMPLWLKADNDPCWKIVHRVYSDYASYDYSSYLVYGKRSAREARYSLDEPRFFRGDSSIMVPTGEREIPDMTKYLEDHPEMSFIVYRDYDRLSYVQYVAKIFGFHKNPYWTLDRDAPPPARRLKEEIQINSASMTAAVASLRDLIEEQLGQWFSSQSMKAPYLPLFHYQSLIKQKLQDLSPGYQIPIQLLLQYVQENYLSGYAEADELFSRGLVTKEHFSKLFRPNDVLVSFEGDQPLGYLCKDWPTENPPENEAQVSSKYTRHATNIDSSFYLKCSCWRFDGQFREEQHTLFLSWPAQDPSNMHITELPVYPLRFANPDVKKHLARRGRILWTCRRRNYVAYNAPDSKQDVRFDRNLSHRVR